MLIYSNFGRAAQHRWKNIARLPITMKTRNLRLGTAASDAHLLATQKIHILPQSPSQMINSALFQVVIFSIEKLTIV